MTMADAPVLYSLPAIDINAGSERFLFLQRVSALVMDGGQLRVERHNMVMGELETHFINLVFPGPDNGPKSGGQLIAQPHSKRVSVEMYSADWDGCHPTRAAYIEYAKAFFQPILACYNSQFSTHHRLRIYRATGYVMPPATKVLFDRFCILANVHALHALDWRRFYLFVRNSRSAVPEGNLRSLLVERGFSLETAQMLSELHGHLWTFKKLRS
jgi:hypothetical protein